MFQTSTIKITNFKPHVAQPMITLADIIYVWFYFPDHTFASSKTDFNRVLPLDSALIITSVAQ